LEAENSIPCAEGEHDGFIGSIVLPFDVTKARMLPRLYSKYQYEKLAAEKQAQKITKHKSTSQSRRERSSGSTAASRETGAGAGAGTGTMGARGKGEGR
jgi:hypothetical protein